MRIMATDQSTNITGIAVLDDGNIVEATHIDLHTNKNIPDRIKQMYLSITNYIDKYKPDLLIVEAVQQQANAKATMMLSQLQGMIIGYAYSNNIPIYSPMPVEWRRKLGFKQGPGVKREELKQQAIDYIKLKINDNNYTEDECEALCIAYSKGE